MNRIKSPCLVEIFSLLATVPSIKFINYSIGSKSHPLTIWTNVVFVGIITSRFMKLVLIEWNLRF